MKKHPGSGASIAIAGGSRNSCGGRRAQGACHPHRPSSHDMRVKHGGTHVRMPQQFLHGANVVAHFEQMRRKAMPKGVATRRLQDPRLSNSGLDRTLNDLLVLMLASEGTGVGIPAQRVGGKHPLPSPLRGALDICERVGNEPRLPSCALLKRRTASQDVRERTTMAPAAPSPDPVHPWHRAQ